ncbi:NUDIX domain-containing protein [Streptomyces sp. NPDC059637]|uniref:NUDIX hydrolase n=1 Tax=Streptomyces sp. NPDC059637 TaxID=3347752 RepID=UPI00368A944E
MIVWVNGASGAGKTSVAGELLDLIPGSVFFDPGLVASGLDRLLPRKRLDGVGDYRELPIWRRLVVDTAAALLNEVGGPLVVPMALLRQDHRDEMFGALAARRIPVLHVLLHAEETILRERAAEREAPADAPGPSALGCLPGADDLPAYRRALSWLAQDAHVVHTGGLTPRQAAERVAQAVERGEGACDIVQTPEPTAETLASGVLLFDDRDRVLLVDPTYKPGWEFPGGVVERGEAPARAGVREVAEELGLDLPTAPRLLVVDWEPPAPPAHGGLRLLFDGGRLGPDQVSRLMLPGSELRAWRFATEDEAEHLLPPVRYRRLRWALRARERGITHNLEAGVPVGGEQALPSRP